MFIDRIIVIMSFSSGLTSTLKLDWQLCNFLYFTKNFIIDVIKNQYYVYTNEYSGIYSLTTIILQKHISAI